MTEGVAAAPSSSRSGGWRRLLRYLAAGLACSAAAVAVLYAISRILALRSDFDWFHAGCGLLALLGSLATIGTALWNLAALERRRSGREGAAPRPLLITSCAAFAAVPFVVGILAFLSPGTRPADAQAWAGYRTTRDGVTSVSASWVQPAIHPRGSRPTAMS